jgi:beta-glucosidase
VLLKNRDGILPLRKDAPGRILLTGKFVRELARGGGAADVQGYDVVTLLAALEVTFGSRLAYAEQPSDEQLKAADVVLLSTGTNDSEGRDRPFALPDAEERNVTRVVGLNPRTVVIVNSGGGIQMTGWNDRAAAIVYAWYPGQSGNTALAEVLCGDVNPSGKLPITIEKRFEDSPAYGYLPPGAKLYTGWGPDNDMSQPVVDVRYEEGVFVGYRWYQAKKIEPLYAFGHGLSYTSFTYEDLALGARALAVDGRLNVEFTVTNTGKLPGAEIAQLYVSAVSPSVPRPPKELKGFSKLMLQPGEGRVVRLRLAPEDFAFWDVATHAWRAEPGEYRILVGGASDRIELEGGITLK